MTKQRPRYLVFAMDQYYPGGGWSDFVGAAVTFEDAQIMAIKAKSTHDDAQVVDLDTMKEV